MAEDVQHISDALQAKLIRIAGEDGPMTAIKYLRLSEGHSLNNAKAIVSTLLAATDWEELGYPDLRSGRQAFEEELEKGFLESFQTARATVVRAEGLNLTFETNDGPVHALEDVNLTVDKGDFVSFIGPSGCGKTTFLRVMADLETPTSGKVSINGVSPAEARQSRAYGYVFQAAGLYPWRTIGANIRLPLEIMGIPKPEQAERVARVLDLVELSGFEKKFPWQLSGGMQQRASIARALSFDADILLVER